MRSTKKWRTIAALMAALCLWTVSHPASSRGEEEATAKVLEVWSLYDSREFDRALEMAEGIHGTEGYARLVLTALLGFLYEEKGRNEEALNRLDSVKPALREALLESARQGVEGEGEAARHRSLLRLYNDVLRARGFIFFREGDCERSVPELQELMGILGVPNPLALTMIGSCLYRKKKYDEAREYFEESYLWYENDALKGEAAYNVAAMHAVQGKAAESAEWFGRALERDRSRWLEKMKSDSDFDSVRNSEPFRQAAGP